MAAGVGRRGRSAVQNVFDSRGQFMKDIQSTNKLVESALSEEDPTQATAASPLVGDFLILSARDAKTSYKSGKPINSQFVD